MFGTLTAIITTTIFLLPGFVVGDLAQRQRAGSAILGDHTGVWVLVHLKDTPPEGSARVVIGKYGQGSAAGRSPVPEHDLLLRDLWLADEGGIPVRPYDPPRSMWVSKSEIAELYLLESGDRAVAERPPGSG